MPNNQQSSDVMREAAIAVRRKLIKELGGHSVKFLSGDEGWCLDGIDVNLTPVVQAALSSLPTMTAEELRDFVLKAFQSNRIGDNIADTISKSLIAQFPHLVKEK